MPPSIAPARWVITGAGGFVARHLLPLLPGAAALARPGGARPGADARVSDLLDVDLLDAGGVRAALRWWVWSSRRSPWWCPPSLKTGGPHRCLHWALRCV